MAFDLSKSSKQIYINDVPLHVPGTARWTVTGDSSRSYDNSSVARTRPTLAHSHGAIRSRGWRDAPAFKIVVTIPEATSQYVKAIFNQAELRYRRGDWSQKELIVEVESDTSERIGAGSNPLMKYTYMLSAPEVWARSTVVETWSTAGGVLDCFDGLSGIVNDAQVIFGGNMNGAIFQDASPGGLKLIVTHNGFVRVDFATGNAFAVNSLNDWTGGSQLNPNAVVLPVFMAGGFEMAPYRKMRTDGSGGWFLGGRIQHVDGSASNLSMAVRGRTAYTL